MKTMAIFMYSPPKIRQTQAEKLKLLPATPWGPSSSTSTPSPWLASPPKVRPCRTPRRRLGRQGKARRQPDHHLNGDGRTARLWTMLGDMLGECLKNMFKS